MTATNLQSRRAVPAARRIPWLLLFALLAAACAAQERPAPPAAAQSRFIEDVPFHAQEDFQCGPAALAMVLNRLGDPVAPEEIARDVFRDNDRMRGTVTLDMGLYPRMRGFSSSFGPGSPEDLIRAVDSGLPVVVMVNQGFAVVRKLHYMVVTGYAPDAVTVNSGQQEGARLSWGDFLPQWKRADYWMLTVSPEENG